MSNKDTKQQIAELEALKGLSDSEIDYSDIPATTPEQWQCAEVGKFYRPVKQQITLRIDADVVAWFKAQGSGYQTAINRALREAMVRGEKH